MHRTWREGRPYTVRPRRSPCMELIRAPSASRAAANAFDMVFRGGVADCAARPRRSSARRRSAPSTATCRRTTMPSTTCRSCSSRRWRPQRLLRPAPRLLARRAPAGGGAPDLPRRVRRHRLLRQGPRARVLGPRRAPQRDPPVSENAGGEAGPAARLVPRRDHVAARARRRDSLPVARRRSSRARSTSARCASISPLRPIANVTNGFLGTTLYRALGGAPAPLVKRAFQLTSIDKYLTKPIAVAAHLHDRDWLAQVEAVDAFMDQMHAYPGRTMGQLYHRFFRVNELAEGTLDLGDEDGDRPRRGARAGARDRRLGRRARAAAGRPPPRKAAAERAPGPRRDGARRAPRGARGPRRAAQHVGLDRRLLRRYRAHGCAPTARRRLRRPGACMRPPPAHGAASRQPRRYPRRHARRSPTRSIAAAGLLRPRRRPPPPSTPRRRPTSASADVAAGGSIRPHRPSARQGRLALAPRSSPARRRRAAGQAFALERGRQGQAAPRAPQPRSRPRGRRPRRRRRRASRCRSRHARALPVKAFAVEVAKAIYRPGRDATLTIGAAPHATRRAKARHRRGRAALAASSTPSSTIRRPRRCTSAAQALLRPSTPTTCARRRHGHHGRQDAFKLRLFKGLKLGKSYAVAVGQPAYPTPSGCFANREQAGRPGLVGADSPWAGELAGHDGRAARRRTRSRRAGWASPTASASTERARTGRSARALRTAASACTSGTSRTCTRACPSGPWS